MSFQKHRVFVDGKTNETNPPIEGVGIIADQYRASASVNLGATAGNKAGFNIEVERRVGYKVRVVVNHLQLTPDTGPSPSSYKIKWVKKFTAFNIIVADTDFVFSPTSELGSPVGVNIIKSFTDTDDVLTGTKTIPMRSDQTSTPVLGDIINKTFEFDDPAPTGIGTIGFAVEQLGAIETTISADITIYYLEV